MVLAYHVIFGAYGFWLPNDPRGSFSNYVGSRKLLPYGLATTTSSRTSVAAKPHDRRLREAAKDALKFSPVHFDARQIAAIGTGFDEYAQKARWTVWACAILPDHVHLVVARHLLRVEQVANLLKGAASKRLARDGLHPLARFRDGERNPTPWARGLWKVFLNTPADVERAIRYVEENPVKAAQPRQKWPFVSAFDPSRPVGK